MHAPSIEPRIGLDHHTGTARLAPAILAGFAATLTMLFLFLVAYNLSRLLARAPIFAPTGGGVVSQWLTNLTHNRLIDAGLSDIYLAAGIYVVGGICWMIAPLKYLDVWLNRLPNAYVLANHLYVLARR